MKNFLLKSYCLSLYGCGLWSLSFSLIKFGLNKLLQKLWCLPRTSHSSIVHCISQIDTISAFIFNCSHSLLSSSLTSSTSLVRSIISASSQCVYSFIGYNNIYGSKHLITYYFSDLYIFDRVRRIRYLYGCHSHCEVFISYTTCN